MCLCICAGRQKGVPCLVRAHSACCDHTLSAAYCKRCQQLGDKFIAPAELRGAERMCLVTFKSGTLLLGAAIPSARHPMKRTGCYGLFSSSFLFLQTLLPSVLRKVYKIFIPFLRKTSKNCHCNSVWVDQYYSILHQAALEVGTDSWTSLSPHHSRAFLQRNQLPPCCVLLRCCFCNGDSCICLPDMKEQLWVSNHSVILPLASFPPSDSYPADSTCTQAHTHRHTFLTDWQ